MRRARHTLAALVPIAAVVLLCGSCLSVTWRREHRFQRPPRGSFARLETGASELTQCLERLGAPLFVYETAGGFAVAFGWFESSDLGGSASLPVSETFNASLSLRNVDRRMKGAVLFFDQEARLLLVRRGLMRDLTRSARRPRPSFDPGD